MLRYIFLTLFLATAVATPVQAGPTVPPASGECTITNYDSAYKLSNGTFDVLEKIKADERTKNVPVVVAFTPVVGQENVNAVELMF